MGEKWRAVAGYEGHYEISNLGRVRSLARKGVAGGILAAFPNNWGYLFVSLWKGARRKKHYIHRLVAIAFGIIRPHEQVDHISGDRANNSPGNLRPATLSENHANRRITPREHTPYKGVDFQKRYGTWRAQIKKNGKGQHLGTFKTDRDAAKAYDEAARRLFGDRARLNFP